MDFELIIIGNELLNGKVKDKNIHWFSKYCNDNNFKLSGVQIIGDSKVEFTKALDKAKLTADIIVTTGGLGPTKDDITKSMMAQYFNKEIQHSIDALKITQAHYKRGNREFNSEVNKYPEIPQDFKALYNPTGYAPALSFEFEEGKYIFNTPGVPSEFQSVVTESITPLLPKSNTFSKHIIIKTWRLPESHIFMKLCPDLWEKLEAFGEVSSLPHLLGVDIGIRISNPSFEQEVLELVNSTALSEFIWHIGSESLEEVIVEKAKLKNIKIGFAESCTGGLCASRITDVSGSSSVFWGSIISYSNEVKINSLDVQSETLKNFGAVSLETAKEMAQGAFRNMNLDIAISTTGIAGPGGGSIDKPVGTVGIGITTKNGSSSEIYNFNGNREELKFRFSQMALFSLLEKINEY
jgi:nicotinamide-nucleotide amidase